jgi:hypothetical protein
MQSDSHLDVAGIGVTRLCALELGHCCFVAQRVVAPALLLRAPVDPK